MVLIDKHLLTYESTRCFALRKMWVEAGLSVRSFFFFFWHFLFFFLLFLVACVFGEPPRAFLLFSFCSSKFLRMTGVFFGANGKYGASPPFPFLIFPPVVMKSSLVHAGFLPFLS